MREGLREYIEAEVLPRYDAFDGAHRRDHAEMVIGQSLEMARRYGLDEDMAYAIAAYHDTGMCEGREQHHRVSGRIVREDERLREWFGDEEIEMMAQAVEDHRASSDHEPRSIYGRVVAEADRFIDADTIIRRTVQYGHDHYPELSHEEQYVRMVEHLRKKYYYGGYLKLWFKDSPNASRLEALRAKIDDEEFLRKRFEALTSPVCDRR
ncbi:MAG: HD domain-containing protein [Bacteroidaceae bacterium]|nr:HD domain-containing protein [Bacteroidaceae bacterium]